MYLEAYCTHIIVYIVTSKVCTYPCFKEVVCAFFFQFILIILRKTSFTKCTLKFTIKFQKLFCTVLRFCVEFVCEHFLKLSSGFLIRSP